MQEHQLEVLVLFRGFHDIPENVHKAFAGLVPADVGARAALGDPVSRPLGVRPGVEVVPLQALVLRLLGDPAHRLPGVYEHPHSSVRDVCKTFAEALFRLYDLVRDAALRRFAGARRVLRRFRRLEFFGISEQLGYLRVLLRAQLRPSRLGSLLVRGGVRAVGLLVHPLRGELRSLFLFKFPEPLHILPAVRDIDPVLHAVRVHLRGVRPDPALYLCGYLGFPLGDELLEEPLHARRRRFRDPLSGVRRGVRLRFKRRALLRLSPQRLALLGAHRLGLFVLHPGGGLFHLVRIGVFAIHGVHRFCAFSHDLSCVLLLVVVIDFYDPVSIGVRFIGLRYHDTVVPALFVPYPRPERHGLYLLAVLLLEHRIPGLLGGLEIGVVALAPVFQRWGEADLLADVLPDLGCRPVRQSSTTCGGRAGDHFAVPVHSGIEPSGIFLDLYAESVFTLLDDVGIFRFKSAFHLYDLAGIFAEIVDRAVVAFSPAVLFYRRLFRVEVGYALRLGLRLFLQLQVIVLGKFAEDDLRFVAEIVHHSRIGFLPCLAESFLPRFVPQSVGERLLLIRSLLGAVDDVSQHIRCGNVRREKRLAVFLGKLHIPHIRRRISPVIGKRDPCRLCPLAQLPRLVFAEIAPHILRYIELAALQIAPDALICLIDPRAVFR